MLRSLIKNLPAIKLRKEALSSALFFLAALIILLLGEPGLLTYPGIAAAIIGSILVLSGYFSMAAALGILSASASLVGQAATVICPYCTMAALSFLVAGITAGILLSSKNHAVFILIPLLIVLLVSVGMYSEHSSIDTRQMAYRAPDMIAATDRNREYRQAVREKRKVPELYISTGCKSCQETLICFVALDPQGNNWQPVIVPDYCLEKGKELLREYGYKGAVASSSASPSGAVPCLRLPDDTVITGTGLTSAAFDEYLSNNTE